MKILFFKNIYISYHRMELLFLLLLLFSIFYLFIYLFIFYFFLFIYLFILFCFFFLAECLSHARREPPFTNNQYCTEVIK